MNGNNLTPLMSEIDIRNSFSRQVQEVEQGYQINISKVITKRNLLIGGSAVAGILVLAPVAWIAATTAISLAIVAATVSALMSAGFYAKIRLPVWIKQNQDRVQLELIQQTNRQKEKIHEEMNRNLAALKAIARSNPIDQLQKYMLEKASRLASFKSAVSQIGGQVKSMGDMLSDRMLAKPNKDYSKKKEALLAMKAAFDGLKIKAKQGDAAITDLREIIEDHKFDHKFSETGKLAMQNLKAMNGEDVMNELLAGESFDEVRENFNKVFTDIEIEISNFYSAKSIKYGDERDGISLDLSAIQIVEPNSVTKKKEQ